MEDNASLDLLLERLNSHLQKQDGYTYNKLVDTISQIAISLDMEAQIVSYNC